METYTSATGNTLEVTPKGKGFTTIRHYAATTHSPAEIVTKHHRSYSAVEKMIVRFNFIRDM